MKTQVLAGIFVFLLAHAVRAEDTVPPLFRENKPPAKTNASPNAKAVVMAVTAFSVSADSPEMSKLSEEIRLLFEQKLAEQKVVLVDRSRIDEAMKEAQLTMAGMTDPDSAKKLGKIISADFIVAGRLTELAGTMIVSGKAIDTQTTRVFPVGIQFKGKDKLIEAI